MTEVRRTFNFDVPASRLWEMVRGFNDLPKWHPAIISSEVEGDGIGTLRRLTVAGVDPQLVEKLLAFDDEGRSLRYGMTDTPLPVANYVSDMVVREDGAGSVLEWSSSFDAAGAPEADVIGLIGGIYDAGYEGLKRVLAGQPKA
jgi:hypothetical protein